MLIAHIMNDVVYNIFDSDKIPEWGPYYDGTLPVFIDITNIPNVHEGDGYDPKTKKIILRPDIPVEEGYYNDISWDSIKKEYIVRKMKILLPLPTITNEMIAQQLADLKIDLIIAGVL